VNRQRSLDADDREDLGALRGSNQSGMRAHNERLVLTLLRRHGALAKADIARQTGLSAQTVSVIMRSLEADGMLLRGDPVRGRVGQPSVPMRLADDGAFFLGLKIGRRSTDLVLTNFSGRVLGRVHLTYRHPSPDATIRFTREGLAHLAGQLSAAERMRIAGLGIAMPFRLWDWARSLGLPDGAMDEWRDRDIRAELAASVDFPVYLQNDATAACGAELVFGRDAAPADFLYFYVGYFIGGGLVLNGSLYTGRTGNAAALGSIPVPAGGGGSRQLIEVASLSVLESALIAADHDTGTLWDPPAAWNVDAAVLGRWIDRAATGLAHAAAAAVAVVDLEWILIDGWIPAPVRRRLVAATGAAMDRINLAGLHRPQLREGTVGPDARALGAASLPLSERFLIDQNVLVRGA